MIYTIPFYTRDNFVKITSLLPGSDWPETYEDWLRKTEMGEDGVKKGGALPVRVNVEPASFEAWCKTNNQPVVRDSILSYCCFVYARKSSGGSYN